MEAVTLLDILAARDHRAQRQQQLLAQFGQPLICFTMNIAGPVKISPLILQAFHLGLQRLEQQLLRGKCPVLHREIAEAATGPEAIFVVDGSAAVLKDMTVDLEEADPMGRLLDLDVLDRDGQKLDRPLERGCLICGAPGRNCARSRAHSVDLLQARTTEILTAALQHHHRQRIAELACRALLFEAATTPKPGLVDRRNNGSHKDMDLFSFLASSAALQPYFDQCAAIGQTTAHLPPEETFRQLRRPGRLAEGDMLRATGGVNTHKGAVFLLGILCGALGRLDSSVWANPDAVLTECAAMTKGLTAQECARQRNTTAGEQFFAAHGIRGIRGEAEAGLPTVKKHGLPAMNAALDAGCALEEAGCRALVAMMAAAEDTALLHRSGMDGWESAKAQASALLHQGITKEALMQMDDDFIRRSWSPGGSADLLAVCYLLHFLQTE